MTPFNSDRSSGGEHLESYLEQALVAAITQDKSGARAETTGSNLIEVPHWDRRIGGYDVVVTLQGQSERSLVVETKIEGVEETLWDLFKVIAAQSEEAIHRGYLAVAAKETTWNSPRDCVDLFRASDDPRVWASADLFREWSCAWKYLLRGGRARPLRIPSQVETRFLGRAPVRAYPGYEVRCIGARAVEDADWIDFEGDWPATAAAAELKQRPPG